MDYEEKLREIINSNSEYYLSEDKAVFAKYFPELKESEDERIRRKLICFVENWKKEYNPNSSFDDYAIYTSDSGECDKILAWLEKQGKQIQLDYEHADIPQKDFAPIEPKKLDADKVIAWLVANICDFEYYVKRFKEDFEL